MAPLIAPTSGDFGSSVGLSWTVLNQGNDAARQQWYEWIWLSRDENVDGSDFFLTEVPVYANQLVPGASYTQALDLDLPIDPTLESGDYFLLVQTDATGQQVESDESNNTLATPIALTVPPTPDLVVMDIVAPAAALSGSTIEVTWTTTNQGSVGVPEAWYDNLFLSTADGTGFERYLGTFASEGGLGSGESRSTTQAVTLPDDIAGDRRIIVVTDVLEQYPEHTGEYNNISFDDQAIAIDTVPVALPASFSSQAGRRRHPTRTRCR